MIHNVQTQKKEENMTSERKRNDFINFIIDATLDEELAKKFFKRKTALGLRRFFQEQGYKDIPLNDCGDILMASNYMHGRGVNDTGKPVDCSSASAKGY